MSYGSTMTKVYDALLCGERDIEELAQLTELPLDEVGLAVRSLIKWKVVELVMGGQCNRKVARFRRFQGDGPDVFPDLFSHAPLLASKAGPRSE